jgi:DNA-binding response OmpR family regulator
MGGNRLLFVDDELAIRMTLPVILRQEGFEVTTAATVAETLEHISKARFDVLLADLNIGQPGDGFTVISAMRRTQPEAVTLILTGFPDFDTALQALRSQVDDYLTKPADIHQLVAMLKDKLKTPGRKPLLQVKRVSTVLRENANAIVQSWFEAAERDSELSRIPLSRAARVDHLPAILAQLADSVDSEEFVRGEEGLIPARSHGIQRREEGYRASQIVAEARLLHNVIAKTLQDHLLSIDLSTINSDLMQIGESLHEQLQESIHAFEEAPIPRTA